MEKLKYCGEVAIVGHPNVGKSSLLNTLLGRKTSIVCNKPQTTRDQVKGLYNTAEMQIVFVDTPGYHQPNNELDKHLNAQARHSLKTANAVILVIDSASGVTPEDEVVIDKLKEYKVQHVLVALNKIDVARQNQIATTKSRLETLYPFEGYFEVCANDGATVTPLLQALVPYLEHTEPMYADETTDLISDDFMISEIVREQCLNLLRMEIPYGVAVVVDSKKYFPDKNRLTIDVSIICEKESQKKIIIGANGSMIREIGTGARKQLLDIFDCNIMLRSFVKVDKDWRNSKLGIEKYGYGK